MKSKRTILTLGTICCFFYFTGVVSANSSWHWVTISPFKIFPVAVILTLLIEIIGIMKLNNLGKDQVKKLLTVVSLANLASFLTPYLERAYRFIPTSGGFSLSSAFNKGPYYMILTGYLVLTILVELPIVYFAMKDQVKKKRNLLITISSLNVLTTGIVAFLERMICKGMW